MKYRPPLGTFQPSDRTFAAQMRRIVFLVRFGRQRPRRSVGSQPRKCRARGSLGLRTPSAVERARSRRGCSDAAPARASSMGCPSASVHLQQRSCFRRWPRTQRGVRGACAGGGGQRVAAAGGARGDDVVLPFAVSVASGIVGGLLVFLPTRDRTFCNLVFFL